MKALSIKQPWAWAIVNLPYEFRKDIENRTWGTKHRGVFLVHASKGFDAHGYERIKWYLHELGYTGSIPTKKEFVYGGIIGKTRLEGVTEKAESRWFKGPYGFKLAGTKAFSEPILYKGQLNFFNIDDDLVREQMEKAIISSSNSNTIKEQMFSVGDKVVCRPEFFDVITQFSKYTSGMTAYYGIREILKIEGNMCAVPHRTIGYNWFNKKELIRSADLPKKDWL